MAEEVSNSVPSHRTSTPSPSQPLRVPPSLSLASQSRSNSSDQDEEGHSRDTVVSTPIFSVCQHELLGGLDINATTPVLPGQARLPPPPDSPCIQLVLPAVPVAKEPEDPRQVLGGFNKRSGSQRLVKRNKTPKKNVGIAIGDFNGLLRDELNIKEGEEIEIISKDTVVSRNIGWWTGRNSKGKIGIFPAACVSCDVPGGNGVGSNNSVYPLEIKSAEVTMKEVVGMGGFGKVFRAIYKGEEVAVKVAKATTFDSLKAVQDVISEAEKFAHLAHSNICALVGVVLVRDVCLLMEYAPGGALSEVLHKSKISLPIDVITNWAAQIASGMCYLHHEAEPSLIHRDLKTSNILLMNVVDPSNLKNNIIKITDFGLAREIEHTTHMSGAGTYPWMAPEVIRTSDFSKKSDVWSFAVVVWELVTGERPYGGLNLFVVAYGVGHGTLSLPIPKGCPEPLTNLMNACWKRDYAERPSFERILDDVITMEDSDFCVFTTPEEFRSMQTLWRGEIQKRFVELKKMEHELQRREQNLIEKITEQETKRKELEEERKKVDRQAEEYGRLISLLRQKTLDKEETDVATQPKLVRPPRVKVFSFRKLFQGLLGKDTVSKSKMVDNPLPNRMESIHAIRRITSSPGNTGGTERRSTSDRHDSTRHHDSIATDADAIRKHMRRSSDEMGYRGDCEQLSVESRENQVRRGSVPTSPRSTHQPIIAAAQHGHTQHRQGQGGGGGGGSTLGSNSLKRELDKRSSRQRSWSDLRSPSPQQLLLPSYLSPTKLGVTSPGPPTSTTSSSSTKPTYLSLLSSKNKLPSQDASSPGSPNVMITPADHPLSQYDSGKDSMTCSDASGHSNSSENQPANMIELDSPVYASASASLGTKSIASSLTSGNAAAAAAADYMAAEFDPLRPSVSHDSLFDSKFASTAAAAHSFSVSPTPTPQPPHRGSLEGSCDGSSGTSSVWAMASSACMSPSNFQFSSQTSTSPKDNISPKQSLTSRVVESGIYPSPGIARPRPKPSKDFPFQTISAPSSRPPSPRPGPGPRERASSGDRKERTRTSSPTGSVRSLRTFSFDSESGGYYSDDTSCSSSLLDLSETADQQSMVLENFNIENFLYTDQSHT